MMKINIKPPIVFIGVIDRTPQAKLFEWVQNYSHL